MEVDVFVAGSVLGWSGGRTTREVEGAEKMLAFLRVTQSPFQIFMIFFACNAQRCLRRRVPVKCVRGFLFGNIDTS